MEIERLRKKRKVGSTVESEKGNKREKGRRWEERREGGNTKMDERRAHGRYEDYAV